MQVKISGAARAVKNGFTHGGNQRVLCNDCGKTRVLHRKFSHNFDFEAVRRSFLERMSLCGVSRVFLISYHRSGEPSSLQRIKSVFYVIA